MNEYLIHKYLIFWIFDFLVFNCGGVFRIWYCHIWYFHIRLYHIRGFPYLVKPYLAEPVPAWV